MKKPYKMVTKNIDDLLPYANNARTHSKTQVKQIASSIKEFGFTNPVLIDSENMIIAGHGRVMAAQLLEMKDVPCIILDGLTDAQKKAYIIADNKLALNAGWDEDLLKIELQSLKEEEFDLELLGFEETELDDLLADVEEIGFAQLPTGEKEPYQQMTFTLHNDQVDLVNLALKEANGKHQDPNNSNNNANALYYICNEFLNGKP